MSLTSILLVIAFTLTIIYVGLGVFAFSLLKPAEKNWRSYVILFMEPLWPFFYDRYELKNRNLLFFGKVLFMLLVTSWLVWAVAFIQVSP